MNKFKPLLLNIYRNNTKSVLTISKRSSGEYIGYRELNYEPARKIKKEFAEFFAGIMWWWVGWHLMTEWRHLIGENIWPQRSEWTDEELGIPKI